ncbi:MAG: hypothetical protein JSS87_02215 [Acidobacteria bacterium]|nr:hypothetical protein [Acidobacteriota bacterium]
MFCWPSWREYIRFGGQVLSEIEGAGVWNPASQRWTDYIYAGGKRIARIASSEKVLQVSGTYGGGWTGVSYTIAAPQMANYMFHDGDQLVVRQRQTGNTHGGILIWADGVTTTLADQDGQPSDDDTVLNTWHNRVISLHELANKTYSGICLVAV